MSESELNQILRRLPAVHCILESEKGRLLVAKYGHKLTAEATGLVLGLWRARIQKGFEDANGEPGELREAVLIDEAAVISDIEKHLAATTKRHLTRIINGTGIILHTNMGRAVLSKRAQETVQEAAASYTNLEYDLPTGQRGSRYNHVEHLLVRLTGAESALVVNNNAAAVLLVMNTLASGKEAVVSRGELVEIGGSFRIPDVLRLGRVTLVEVGTTNRTHLKDYQAAVGENTALILKVHTSNFKITGFAKAVERRELIGLARQKGVPFVEDLGSGTLLDLSSYGLQEEEPVSTVIREGADVVTFSGDKLLGGPQAGIILGRTEYISKMKANQLNRALRIDKLTLAALEATLQEYLNPSKVLQEIPFYRMLTAANEALAERAQIIINALSCCTGWLSVEVIPTIAHAGGGSLPGQDLPSTGIALRLESRSAAETEQVFRELPVPVIGYVRDGRFIIDMRTLLPGDEETLVQGIKQWAASRR